MIMAIAAKAEFAKFLIGEPPGVESRRRVGRPTIISPEIGRRLVEMVDRERHLIDSRRVPSDRKYGDRCTDTDAIRSLMNRLHRSRLLSEGLNDSEVGSRVAAFAASAEFTRRLRSHKARLSRLRRQLPARRPVPRR